MPAFLVELVEWLLNFWFAKKPAYDEKKAQNAQNNVNGMSDDDISKRVSNDWTKP